MCPAATPAQGECRVVRPAARPCVPSFAGALLALSDEPAHLAVARDAKHGRARGCFALTEVEAGVYSGAVGSHVMRA